ncbi:MAG: hypothetical protein ACKN9E_13035 [Microcystaceae cyanobacterium]
MTLIADTEYREPDSNLLLEDVNITSQSEEPPSTLSPDDRLLLVSLLCEYGDKLFSLCEKISHFKAKDDLFYYLSVGISGVFSLLIYKLFYFTYFYIISFVLLLCWSYIAYMAWQDRKKLQQFKNEARRISVRLEKVIRLGYQIQENLTSNLVKKLELDLRLADAESALEYYKKICH